jgi:hypothetical protein
LDEESHVTLNPVLQAFLKLLKFPLIAGVMNLLSELYIIDHYLAFFHMHPLEQKLTQHPSYSLFLTLTLAGVLLKNLHNVLHLIVSAVRIVKLDVR